jgi:cyanophycinase
VSVVTALAATVAAPARAAPPPRGTLIMIGGALSDDNAEIYGEIVRQAGGPQARIGVITAASIPRSRDPDAGTPRAANSVSNGRIYLDLLRRYGAGRVEWVPIDLDRAGAADDPRVVAQVRSMNGFVFGGGDQMRLVTTLLHGSAHTDSKVLAVIRSKFAAGAVVAGSSAGAQIQAGPDMVTGGASYQALRDGSRPGYFEDDATALGYLPAGGFGFFTGGLLDTHFSVFGRLGRSIRLAADTGRARVFGLDPDTALEARGGELRVLGRHGVSVLDLRAATAGVRGGRWSIAGVRWSYLTDGFTYRPDTWTWQPGAPAFTPAGGPVTSPVPDIFDSPLAPGFTGQGFRLTRAALLLAGSAGSPSLTGLSYESGPRYVIELSKGPGFSVYGNGHPVAFGDLRVALYAR